MSFSWDSLINERFGETNNVDSGSTPMAHIAMQLFMEAGEINRQQHKKKRLQDVASLGFPAELEFV